MEVHKMSFNKTLHIVLFLFLCHLVNAQELPPIVNYSPTEYGGDNQNWMISQGGDKFIYVANNMGLMEYNGSKWNLYPSPNNSVLRAVKVVRDRIYTGCYAEFGYWVKNDLGSLEYQSLIPKLVDFKFSDNQIWNILAYENWILFQSGRDLFFYNEDTEEFKIISSTNIIYKVFKVNDQIYYHVANEGIYKIENGEPKMFIDVPVVINDRVINIYEREKELFILTRNSGFYAHKDQSLKKWTSPSEKLLRELNIFSSIKLENGDLVLGTISNGLFIMNALGEIEYDVNQKKGLGNNTVLALFEDADNNVWVGLDNGITCINVVSPIKSFIDYDGVLGTVYTINTFQNSLYVGTNQGLFFRSLSTPDAPFTFVKGTAGQVWSLYNDNNEHLLCGHHLGTFIIDGDQSKSISSVLGAWNFRKLPNHDNLLLQGNYSGLHILEKVNNEWKERNKVLDFNISSRFFEIDDENQIWVNHEYKGVFRLTLDDALQKAVNVHIHSELTNRENSSLVKHQDNILFAAKEGFYSYQPSSEQFTIDTILNNLLSTSENTSGKMVVDKNDRLWTFSLNNINYIDNNDVTNQLEITNIPIPSNLRKGILSFENIQLIEKEKYVLGTTTGYLTIDLSKKKPKKDYVIFLNEISIKDLDEDVTFLDRHEHGIFDHKNGILSFDYSVPDFDKFLEVKYQYKLAGHLDRWSNWSTSSVIQFENLTFGDFTFEVRGKVGNQLTTNIETYAFTVKRPWYISNVALVFYLILLGFIGFLIHEAYKFYYERILKHEQIKNEKTIIQIQNEKLNQEIENKNSELAISTMSIIRKNELLNKIKKDLQQNNIQSTIKLIDNNLSNNNDWKLFKKAFNNADKDFLDKIKEKHPELTPNDLRFCAYLRLNLSSKEIAPLLNISTKSVETKRYRLRKRLGLNHEDGLVDYIIKF
ncbi:helix-turn-helix and ligand-binding sensor domain-containing protein [Portibacter lacus]|uniref:HTH luxR-type domain-containing protein n=1 Tax=Portibacter lacus TaxID=1099794 RepID=A0AA37WCU0_9BACT|nr:two-component regulator propeller domain-containing protein [Portibacter lacus]GLR15389.1 hypothetical protein GCM10007940_00040 [Portibacter lacus]